MQQQRWLIAVILGNRQNNAEVVHTEVYHGTEEAAIDRAVALAHLGDSVDVTAI